MTAPAESRVLSISDDPGLGLSRRLLLENAGYHLESVASDSVLTPSYARSFDAAVICQSVNPDSALQWTAKLRRYHPGIQILRVNLQAIEPDSCFDGVCDALTDPRRFLEAVGRMLTRIPEDSASAPPIAT